MPADARAQSDMICGGIRSERKTKEEGRRREREKREVEKGEVDLLGFD